MPINYRSLSARRHGQPLLPATTQPVAAPSARPPLLDVPDEILLIILEFCTPTSKCNLWKTSRRFKGILNHEFSVFHFTCCHNPAMGSWDGSLKRFRQDLHAAHRKWKSDWGNRPPLRMQVDIWGKTGSYLGSLSYFVLECIKNGDGQEKTGSVDDYQTLAPWFKFLKELRIHMTVVDKKQITMRKFRKVESRVGKASYEYRAFENTLLSELGLQNAEVLHLQRTIKVIIQEGSRRIFLGNISPHRAANANYDYTNAAILRQTTLRPTFRRRSSHLAIGPRSHHNAIVCHGPSRLDCFRVPLEEKKHIAAGTLDHLETWVIQDRREKSRLLSWRRTPYNARINVAPSVFPGWPLNVLHFEGLVLSLGRIGTSNFVHGVSSLIVRDCYVHFDTLVAMFRKMIEKRKHFKRCDLSELVDMRSEMFFAVDEEMLKLWSNIMEGNRSAMAKLNKKELERWERVKRTPYA